ncbi:MAG: Tol-Pal system protein TolB [Campylobacterales bacterium]|nr:Tol-Pal system protein TolB [Campylobacterales bacterium]
MFYWIFLIVGGITLLSADTTLEVTKNVGTPAKFVIEDGSISGGEDAQKFHKMLSADMKVVSLFDVDETYTAQNYESMQPSLLHKDAAYILRYQLIADGSGGIKANIKLLQNNVTLFTKSYLLKQSEMGVFLAHSIAYDINAKMGGAPLEWMKRKVLLVRLTGAKHSDIIVADYTLSYQKVILSGGLYGFVKWANREQSDFYYTSLNDSRPTIYKANLVSGNKSPIISSDGMAVCSDVSENGTKLLLTLAPSGQPDIYWYDTSTKEKKRLTEYSGIDVNGQFMGNDTMAFVSDRFGKPNIFSMKIGNSAISQLVFEGKNNSTFSAYRNLLVYKTRDEQGFDLHLISLNSNGTRVLTSSGNNDTPRFSYDGEAILHIKQESSRSSLGIIRLGLNKSFSFPLHVGKIQSIDW